MTKSKRPQDWNAEERLNMVISCAALDDEKTNELCRTKGIFPHHIKQWKQDFIERSAITEKANIRSDNKVLRKDIKALQKELNRKDKALAEYKFKYSILSINIILQLLLNEDLFVKLIISLILEI